MKGLFIQAPAKINLHLDIGPRRADGFHPLRSLFQMVSLYDDITVYPAKKGHIDITGFQNLPLEENILFQCWDRACRKGLFHQGLSIHCTKRIPSGAGLGGGSSDCASLIQLMSQMEPEFWSFSDCRNMAEELGSDVPFFLSSPLALVEGRGEILFPLDLLLQGQFLLFKPDIHISSGDAYKWLDKDREMSGTEASLTYSKHDIMEILNREPASWSFFNHFENPVFARFPQIAEKSNEMKNLGADFVRLSGSGSVLFAFFSGLKPPEMKKKSLLTKKPDHYIVNALDKIPGAIVV